VGGGCEVREKACTISLQLKYATVKCAKFINTHENIVQSICMCHTIAAVCKYLKIFYISYTVQQWGESQNLGAS